MRARVVAVATAVALVLSAFVVTVAGTADPAQAAGGGTVDLTGVPTATFTVQPGVEQVTVTGATPRAPLTLVHAGTLERILTLYTDDLGQAVFQYVPADFLIFDQQTQGVLPTTEGGAVDPGQYRVVAEQVTGGAITATLAASDPFSVLGVDDVPDPTLYDQVLPFVTQEIGGGVPPGSTDEDGYGYLTVRDGVQLSVNVRLPDPALYGQGPYPTVIQYSGYAPSRPGSPSGADAGGFLANVLGFAYVGVNVRGSGCSGGVFDVFNAAQAADGYDVVETVARQPWVKNGKPGMIGISYSGITQLYVAATNPPSLAAITPLSVIEDPWDQQWPGGIYNSGFTKSWLASRDDEASGGAQWVKDRVSGGDATCQANLAIRSQNVGFEAFARSLQRRPADADARKLSDLVDEIDVPVWLTGAWQDEQTGARFATMLDDFDAVPAGQKKFTMFNGHHPDGYTPLVLTRWFEFLSFYVDQTVPKVNPTVATFAGPDFETFFGTPGLTFEPNRFVLKHGSDYAAALADYQSEQPVRVLFEVGASPDYAAYPMAQRQRWAIPFGTWPPPAAEPRTFYLGSGGSLLDAPPAEGEINRYAPDPDVLGTHYFVSGDHTKRDVVNDWKPTTAGRGLAYETGPLTEEMVLAGDGYVDLWFRTDGTDAPLEVVLSEVYEDVDPSDGQPAEEVRIQHGLLRPGYRTLDAPRSTTFLKEHLFSADDYQALTPGEWVQVQVPFFAMAHPVRAGSRLRLEINTAGGDSPLWDFESDGFGATANDVALGGAMPSSMVLPVLPSDVPLFQIPDAFDEQDERPPCDSLRGQPCRAYTELVNQVVTDPPATTSTSTPTDPTSSTAPTPSSSTPPAPRPAGAAPAAVAVPAAGRYTG